MILGTQGMTPVRLAKKVAHILKLPLMVHVGEPPPLYGEVLEVFEPTDIVTHCFNGKKGGSLAQDEDLFRLAARCAEEGIRLDIGHGAASFSFRVGEIAIKRGLPPISISTDLHKYSIDGPVWDMATTMSKVHAIGLGLLEVIRAVTIAPMSVIGLTSNCLLSPGKRAEFTVFEVLDCEDEASDSMWNSIRIKRMIEPRMTILGAETIDASRHKEEGQKRCPNCGALLKALSDRRSGSGRS